MTLQRGMKPWREDAIKLQFVNYLDRSKLPAVPRTYGHVKRNDVPWGMLGNDEVGDCVLAGRAHETMVYALATRRGLPSFTSDGIKEQYFALTGGKDEGLDPISVAKWSVTTGLKDAAGELHKVKAFASVNNDKDLDIAAYIFGACGIGFLVPDTALAEFDAGKPWVATSEAPNREHGHYVPLVGRNSRGLRFVVTWGRLQAVTDAFWRKYFVGAVAYFSLEYMLANGISPEGIKEAQLDSDLRALV